MEIYRKGEEGRGKGGGEKEGEWGSGRDGRVSWVWAVRSVGSVGQLGLFRSVRLGLSSWVCQVGSVRSGQSGRVSGSGQLLCFKTSVAFMIV